jgi:hypothetical protein
MLVAALWAVSDVAGLIGVQATSSVNEATLSSTDRQHDRRIAKDSIYIIKGAIEE